MGRIEEKIRLYVLFLLPKNMAMDSKLMQHNETAREASFVNHFR
jgi:hypothetical protein